MIGHGVKRLYETLEPLLRNKSGSTVTFYTITRASNEFRIFTKLFTKNEAARYNITGLNKNLKNQLSIIARSSRKIISTGRILFGHTVVFGGEFMIHGNRVTFQLRSWRNVE